MSRSSKKHPWVTDHKLHNDMKKFANKKVRNQEDLPNGRAFKKVFCSYDICDYKWRQTKEEAIEEYENALKHTEFKWNRWLLEEYPTLESWLWHWKKYYLRK